MILSSNTGVNSGPISISAVGRQQTATSRQQKSSVTAAAYQQAFQRASSGNFFVFQNNKGLEQNQIQITPQGRLSIGQLQPRPNQQPANYFLANSLPRQKFVANGSARPMTGISRVMHTKTQDRILSAKNPHQLTTRPQTLQGLLTQNGPNVANFSSAVSNEYDNQRTHKRVVEITQPNSEFNRARATSAAINRKARVTGLATEADLLKQMGGITTNPSVPYFTNQNPASLHKASENPTHHNVRDIAQTAASSNDITLNTQRLNHRLNSVGSQDVDRIAVLNRISNSNRPTPALRPVTTQAPRPQVPINFYNQGRTPAEKEVEKAHGLDNYQIGKSIGQGAYAQVRLCMDKRNQHKYAIKIYEKIKLQDPMKKKACQREIAVLKRLNHPGVIYLHDLMDSPKQIFMVTDYIKGISLREYVKQLPNRQVRELTARRIFRQVVEAVAYLHCEQGVIHRDIKLDNILIEEGTRMVKLIDFGFSVLTNTSNQRLKVFCGTPSYMAPEITRKMDYEGRPVDIWALGVLLYVMLTGQFPFRGISEQDLYQRIQRGQYRNHELLNGDARRIVKAMLELDPSKRVTAAQVLKEPYIKGDDIRMTAFEMAGALSRQISGRNYSRDHIKIAHNNAVEQLRAKKYTQEEIEACFKEGVQSELGQQPSDAVYQTYKSFVLQSLSYGKTEKISERKFKKIEEIEPEPDCEQPPQSDVKVNNC